MCAILLIRATTDEGKPHPAFTEEVEIDTYPGLEDGEPLCLCGRGDDSLEGEAARRAIMEAMRPLLEAVRWGNIVIEVR